MVWSLALEIIRQNYGLHVGSASKKLTHALAQLKQWLVVVWADFEQIIGDKGDRTVAEVNLHLRQG